jgi:hypothetical protein
MNLLKRKRTLTRNKQCGDVHIKRRTTFEDGHVK